MIATLQTTTTGAREWALPIHPAVTLEGWAGAAHLALIDGFLSGEQEADLIEQLHTDPEAMRFYRRACRDETELTVLFSQWADLASPVW
ncbi:MAG: hypothetical protein ACE37H_02960 [Phycisphaeraceae bacterium]